MKKLTKKCLIKGLKGFPLEVAEKMRERQKEQTGVSSIKKIQEEPCGRAMDGVFTWAKTIEGDEFWYDVIVLKRFDLFFEKYPKEV